MREKIKIADVYEGLYDGPHATPPAASEGAIFLGISNITNKGHLDLSDVRYISKDDLPKWTKRVTPRAGDIVFSYEATLNLYAVIPEGFHGCLGRRMALIRPDENKALGKYLYYYFFSSEWREEISSHVITGATVDRIPLSKFPDFLINLPSLEKQKNIVTILASFDDLIENNRRQIKLLEEAAQLLYKEWFVNLKFPGHENVQIVDGVPIGWKKGIIGDLVTFKRGKNLTKNDAIPGSIPVVAGGMEPSCYHSEANAKGPVVTVSASGANAGFTRLYTEDIWASDCSYIDSEGQYIYFIYCFLKINRETTRLLQKGSAQPHVYAKDLNKLELILPNEDLIRKFDCVVSDWFSQIKNLNRQIILLTEARDLFLPKLMSGEIEV